MSDLDRLLERADRSSMYRGDTDAQLISDLAAAVRKLREENEGMGQHVALLDERLASERAESATLRARLDAICPRCASGLCSAHQPGTKGVEAFARLNRKLTDDLARERKLREEACQINTLRLSEITRLCTGKSPKSNEGWCLDDAVEDVRKLRQRAERAEAKLREATEDLMRGRTGPA